MQNRNSNFELLRLILMVLIIIGHGICHGLGLGGISPTWGIPVHVRPADMGWTMTVYMFCIPAVNIFILITGYFKLKVSATKVLKLTFALAFYTLLFCTLYYAITGSYVRALRSLLIFSNSPYWFIIDYCFLMLLSPMINNYLDTCSKQAFRVLLAGMLLISCYIGFVWHHAVNATGYDLFQFVTLYCLGRYIAMNHISIRRGVALVLYVACSLIAAGLMHTLHRFGMDSFAAMMPYYNNPLVVLSALGVFFYFQQGSVQSHLINKLAISSLSIYLFQSSAVVSDGYYTFVERFYASHNVFMTLLVILSCSLLIAGISIAVDQIRLWAEVYVLKLTTKFPVWLKI
jgi:surface polysaccharide O-acyltransferase-like enzyme